VLATGTSLVETFPRGRADADLGPPIESDYRIVVALG
jgi:hypothetical protein